MLTEKEIFKKILKIEIYTRFLASQLFTGKYTSSFRGKGIEFAEVRPYSVGDDVRNIDWNITARMNYPYIKEYTEERQLSMVFLMDISASMHFGTGSRSKRELVSEVASLLSWTAAKNGDKAGLILCTDGIEKYIPPRKGRFHILRIIREMLYSRPESRASNLSSALEFATKVFRKKIIIFVFSDFFGFDGDRELRILSRKHDVIGVRVLDPGEVNLPPCGISSLKDTETGRRHFANLSSDFVRKKYGDYVNDEDTRLKKLFSSAGCDLLQLGTERDYITTLLNFFRSRARRR